MRTPWISRDVREALRLEPGVAQEPQKRFHRVTTDSRDVEVGDLFLALQGERFDGHDFVKQAVARGATGVVVERLPELEMEGPDSVQLFQVPDSLRALGDLATYRRKALGARVVGITGSSGKTSTKDLLAAAVEGTHRVHATEGNYNNRIGVPLTILAAPAETEVMVLEMGTNEPGEIRILTEIAGPWVGVITTVSPTHLEKLGSLAGVLEEKLDLLRGLPENGVAVVGDDPWLLQEMAQGLASTLLVVGQGQRTLPENRPESLTAQENGCFEFRWRGEVVNLGVPGRHSVQNALLALAVADLLGVPAAHAARRIGAVRPGSMRSEIRSVGDLTLLVDCYNANPQSLTAALDLLVSMGGRGRRVAVLGSMLELGDQSRRLHIRSLEEALVLPLDLVLLTGLFAEVAGEVAIPEGGPSVKVAPDLEEARDVLLGTLEGSETILLKGSRGVAMEALIPDLEARFGPGRAA